MPIIRTPEEPFENLPDYPFQPHYLEFDDKRIHYVDEGAGSPILCLHGEPTWAFLYRHMIPLLATQHRVLAFDFVGFGRSDKYSEPEEYSFDLHQNTLIHFIEQLDLQNITLIVHDWGGLVGLPTVAKLENRIDRIVILNTFLPTGEEPPSRGFLAWHAMVQRAAPDLPIGAIMRQALPDGVAEEVIAAYEAPFPDVPYRAGASIWPLMVPIKPDDPLAQIMQSARQYFTTWTKPVLVMFATDDPILGAAAPLFTTLMPHAQRIDLEAGGHFLQESQGATLAQHILDFMGQA